MSCRATAYYFNEDGSFEIGWDDHTLELIKQDRQWKILNEDVSSPSRTSAWSPTPPPTEP